MSSSLFLLSSCILPPDDRFLPSVSNGHLGVAFTRNKLFMNLLYNGAHSDSHRAAIPNWGQMKITGLTLGGASVQYKEQFQLNMWEGVFTQHISSPGIKVTLTLFAHRVKTRLVVRQLTIARVSDSERGDEDQGHRHSLGGAINVLVTGLNDSYTSPDLTLNEMPGTPRVFSGTTVTPESNSSQPIPFHCLVDPVGSKFTLPEGVTSRTWTLLMSASNDLSEATTAYDQGKSLSEEPGNPLLQTHCDAWSQLWLSGRIDCKGSDRLSRITNACLYYLYSSLPFPGNTEEGQEVVWPYCGISPCTMAYGDDPDRDYLGHVFWDQETWMFPPILLLQRHIGEALMRTRTRTLDQAKLNAAGRGEKGARFPWESAYTGVPTSPSDDCENLEIHVTGDIALALSQYIDMTGDMEFLQNGRGLELADSIAEFWASRLVANTQTGLYEIKDIMPPDEFHYPVDNSAFTNELARFSILLPRRLRRMMGVALGFSSLPNTSLGQGQLAATEVDVTKIYVPFDEHRQCHPEFDGYQFDAGRPSIVKQADIALLGHPLHVTSGTVLHNDLVTYEKVTSSRGPAMTWGVYSIGYLLLCNSAQDVADNTSAGSETDEPRLSRASDGSNVLPLEQLQDSAAELFERQLLHVQEPFMTWAENPDGSGAGNFQTGMGGYLQSLLFGWAGLVIQEESLLIHPRLIPGTSGYTIIGLDYKGGSFYLDISQDTVSITLTTETSSNFTIQLATARSITLRPKVEVQLPCQKLKLVKSS